MPTKNPNETVPMEVPGEKHEQGHSLGDPKGGRPANPGANPGVNAGQQSQGQQGGKGQIQQGGSGQRNEGEGNRTAARQYNAGAQQSAQNPARTDRQAHEAKRAIDSPEGEELERAEEVGKKPARH